MEKITSLKIEAIIILEYMHIQIYFPVFINKLFKHNKLYVRYIA